MSQRSIQRRRTWGVLLATAAGSAIAQPGGFDIPAGPLAPALNTLARQAGLQLLYRPDLVRDLSTPGVHDIADPLRALDALLQGTGLQAQREGSDIVLRRQAAVVAPAVAAAPAKTPPVAAAPAQLATLHVTGSRIPRAQLEGPAPVTVIDAEQIRANGFRRLPDVLRALTQNGGETQSQQSASGADYTPGAEQVSLRGLGPNHTLVLINGRRVADFPLPYNGRSNFVDVASMPLAMVERIEVLSGSASAIYGSDAIAGVINILLKRDADGTTLDARVGQSSRGDARTLQASLTHGFTGQALSGLVSIEANLQQPLWAYQRDRQDSSSDAPTARAAAPRRAFLRTDADDRYLDPGAAACAGLASLNGHDTGYSARDGAGAGGLPGYYCGSPHAIAYGTVLHRRRSLDAYATLHRTMGTRAEWFADVQVGLQDIALMRGVQTWAYMRPDGNEEGYFYNRHTAQVEYWYRQFAPEEMGGLAVGMVHNRQQRLSIATGVEGELGTGGWSYEAVLSHAQARLRTTWPQIVAARANAWFLGEQVGVDPRSGYPSFDADPARLYTALTPAEYAAIAARTTYRPQTRVDAATLTLRQPALFGLRGGDAGLALTAEVGEQAYALHPDPLATRSYYYSWRDADGAGQRRRWALAAELRLPLLEPLTVDSAVRYDRYAYAGRQIGRFTWSTGLEWRPSDRLLLRASQGLGFRAPDLHYLYAGEGIDESQGTDYVRCAREDAAVAAADCRFDNEPLLRRRAGNLELKPETSRAWTAGLVWSPLQGLDLSVDYFAIDLRDQVEDLSADRALRDEADCRLGRRPLASPACQQSVSRVVRTADGRLYAVALGPMNLARTTTSGVDALLHGQRETRFGTFDASLAYTWVREYRTQLYAGEPMQDAFAVNSRVDMPRTKASASLTWSRQAWSATLHAQRLGRLPSWASSTGTYDPSSGLPAWIGASYRVNASVECQLDARSTLSLGATNLFDAMPPRDRSAVVYPFYDLSWFDTVGRQLFMQYNRRFGAAAP
ncbi:outer membrane receptor protein involved in Fe transport [Xanthomonas sacchari]|uniref:TonB-dependent receptor n=1 Tax=unclassified Xanthomonas TaxID=2643310 RepID=UPI0013690F5C|nr:MULTISPECIES: TonB-dependent receptor [unclassified Xanthomonas]MBB6366265.1 outer membrane receptor protein involved in Fe transport [Xanthomonas sp. F10]MXV33687.1 TonB-dependent receptor [Xanthomonas sp. LMG 8989]